MKNGEALMVRARRANPVPPDAYEDLSRSVEAQELLDAIVRRERAAGPPARARSRGRGPRVRSAVLAAMVLLAGLGYLAAADRPQTRLDPAWSAGLVAFAQGSPRLLIAQEGWMVTSAEEAGSGTGEMLFANHPRAPVAAGSGRYWMSLSWYPAEMHESYVGDRRTGADGSSRTTIAGHEAIVFEHRGTAPIGRTFYALWTDGDHSLELRSDVIPELEQFVEVAATLHAVDTDTWLSAMPSGVVTPAERAAAVDTILQDIPVPAGVDVGEIKDRKTVTNSLDYEVTTAVVCGWLRQWIEGDEAARREAVAAMTGAREWDAFRNPGPYGFETYVFEVADAMAAGRPVNDDRSLPIGVGYQRHVGCAEG
jgi:hypothetical protein